MERTQYGDAMRPLVMLQAWPGEEQPRFEALARHLPPERPFYTIKPPPPSRASSMRTMRHYAEYYVEEIKSAGIEPPYHVLGWSFSSLAALEMAGRFDQDVSSILMIDTWPRIGLAPTSIWHRSKVNRARQNTVSPIRFAVRSIRHEWRGFRRFVRISSRHYSKLLKGIGHKGRGLTPDDIVAWSIEITAVSFRPRSVQTPTLFVTAQGTIDYHGFSPFMIWRNYLPSDTRYLVADGDHFTMWNEPMVKTFAKDVVHYIADIEQGVQS